MKDYLLNRARRRGIGLLLLLAGAFLVLIPWAARVQGVLGQRSLQREWDAAVTARPVPKIGTNSAVRKVKKTSDGDRTDGGFPPTRITIPEIGLSAVVVEGITSRALRKGPGHFPKTANPGRVGNCCIAGHRNIYGSWFRRLNELAPGDQVVLSTPEADLVYEVAGSFKVLPEETYVLEPVVGATLTLITCTPTPRPTQRLVVTADLVETRRRSSSVL